MEALYLNGDFYLCKVWPLENFSITQGKPGLTSTVSSCAFDGTGQVNLFVCAQSCLTL